MAKLKEVVKRKLDFTGTPGKMVDASQLDGLVFGGRAKVSPYDKLLTELKEATPKPPSKVVLEFESLKARASVYARAKKLEMRVSFAELGGKLYVRYEGDLGEDVIAKRRQAILDNMSGIPVSYIEMKNKLVALGDVSVTAAEVDIILVQLMKAGKVVRQDGGKWRLK